MNTTTITVLAEGTRLNGVATSLAGHRIACTCGLIWTTTLSAKGAELESADHLSWHQMDPAVVDVVEAEPVVVCLGCGLPNVEVRVGSYVLEHSNCGWGGRKAPLVDAVLGTETPPRALVVERIPSEVVRDCWTLLGWRASRARTEAFGRVVGYLVDHGLEPSVACAIAAELGLLEPAEVSS